MVYQGILVQVHTSHILGREGDSDHSSVGTWACVAGAGNLQPAHICS